MLKLPQVLLIHALNKCNLVEPNCLNTIIPKKLEAKIRNKKLSIFTVLYNNHFHCLQFKTRQKKNQKLTKLKISDIHKLYQLFINNFLGQTVPISPIQKISRNLSQNCTKIFILDTKLICLISNQFIYFWFILYSN